ncbi:MAG: hypothetical protein OER82_05820 [Nitrosopumilus sp.]|nr:hypothetical protein [Nitrosopumilus sp.]MDH3765310.1 hypothetical protein [Nitrosopumilus sp.]
MGFWDDVKEKVSDTIIEIKKNPYLDVVAKSALENIPVIGNILVKLYENAPGKEENKTEQIIQLLQNLEKLNSESLEVISREIKNNENLLINVHDSLTNLTNETSSIYKQLEKHDVNFVEIKIGQTEIHLDVLKLQKKQQKILNELQDVGNNVRLLYEEIGTIQSKLGIEKENDTHIKCGSGYKIYCPDGWEIMSKDEMKKGFDNVINKIENTVGSLESKHGARMDMVINLKEKIIPFSPSVNIAISDAVYDNLIQQVNASNILVLTLGGCIVNQNIDEWSNVATQEMITKTETMDIFTLQKHYLHKKKHYIITITQLSSNQLQNTPKISADLKTISQSFTFV